MPSPTPTSVDLPAGLLKNKSPLEGSGRYVDAQWVRFWQKQPEKIGGWIKLTSTAVIGKIRALLNWNDLTTRSLLAIGTTTKLYALDNNATVPTDITPLDGSVTLTSAFSTVSGSKIVTVTSPAHGKKVNQLFSIASGPVVGGLNMTGTWTIISPVTNNTFTFLHTGAAATTATTTGSATLVYEYEPGSDAATAGLGWGAGAWGRGTWGTPRTNSNILVEPRTWSLDHFGQLLLANPSNGPLFQWDPSVIPFVRATRVAASEAPGAMRSFFVTPERFVIALGASLTTARAVDNMNMRWCDQNDLTSWTPTDTGTAGIRRLTEGKRLVAGTPYLSGVSLIWSDTTLYTHTFTGSQFVFDTHPVASEAGLIGPHAFTKARGSVYWLGNSAFQVYSGSVSIIPNAGDISDWVFSNITTNYGLKTVSFFVPKYNEVWWIIAGSDDTEPNLYAAVNLDDYSWITGTLSRTAAAKQPNRDYRPLLAAPDGYVYTHETGLDADGVAIETFIETGLVQMSDGSSNLEVIGFVPDFARVVGPVTLEVNSYDRPNSPNPTDYGVAQIEYGDALVDLRVEGRLLAYRIHSNEIGGDFRFGKHQFEIQPNGARR